MWLISVTVLYNLNPQNLSRIIKSHLDGSKAVYIVQFDLMLSLGSAKSIQTEKSILESIPSFCVGSYQPAPYLSNDVLNFLYKQGQTVHRTVIDGEGADI